MVTVESKLISRPPPAPVPPDAPLPPAPPTAALCKSEQLFIVAVVPISSSIPPPMAILPVPPALPAHPMTWLPTNLLSATFRVPPPLGLNQANAA